MLTVVTVLYGGAETLTQTLPTWVAAAGDLPIAFLFIDNSEDREARRIVEAQSWQAGAMRYIHSGGNVGFAAGANSALREARTEAVFLLNPDVYVREGQFSRLLAIGMPQRPYAISLVTDGRATAGIGLNAVGWFSDRPVGSSLPCLGPSGGAALFARAQILELGGFTNELFAWGEDAALALRLWSRGVVTGVVDLRMEHTGGHSVASTSGLRRKAYWLARNRVWILRAQYSRPYQASFGLIMFCMLLLNGARKVPSRTAREYFRGLFQGVINPPPWSVAEVITVRQHIDYRRTGVSDSLEVLRTNRSEEAA